MRKDLLRNIAGVTADINEDTEMSVVADFEDALQHAKVGKISGKPSKNSLAFKVQEEIERLREKQNSDKLTENEAMKLSILEAGTK
jgi:hypothetical protein